MMTSTAAERVNRAQFLLGPLFTGRVAWERTSLSESLRLSTHPDLPISTFKHNATRITLLGFILDWSNPQRTDRDIVAQLARTSTDFNACWRATSELGGRWILIYQHDNEAWLFHDASGLRQVCFERTAAPWCASQPDLLAEHSRLEPDPRAIEFIEWHAQKKDEYWFPGDRSAFKNVHALLPNHALNLVDGRVERYWPDTPPGPRDTAEVLDRACRRLQGSMEAAVRRFDVALGLSAGWDSRMVLAAARPVIDRISIYNGCGSGVSPRHPDVLIPRRLGQRLGLRLDLVKEGPEADSDFSYQFHRHSWNPHPRFASGMQADFSCYEGKKVAVVGNVAEIGKLQYRAKVPTAQGVDGSQLAGLYWYGHPFAAEALDDWLGGIPEGSDVNVLDLFYWEQRLGRWLSANFLEFDFAWRDIFAPFNIRALMVDLLASDEDNRRPPEHELYRRIIDSLWPELLDEPINPVRKPTYWTRLRRRVRKVVSGGRG